MTSTEGRLSLSATAATLLSALTLHPLVQGWSWFVAVVVVVCSVAITGAAVRQVNHWWVQVVGAQIAVAIVVLTALFVRQEALWGLLPNPDALRATGDLISKGSQITHDQAPPVEATAGVLLIIAGGLALVGLAVDILAVTARRPAVAGLPLLTVYSVPAAVLPGGLPWYWFVFAAAGYLMLVGADASDRIRAWGRVLGDPTRANAAEPGGSWWAPGGSGRSAAAVLAVAVVVPAFIPGLTEPLIGNTGTGTGGNGAGSTVSRINPILDLRQQLTARSDQVMLTYRTTVASPEPLRIVTDDEFTGGTWQPNLAPLGRTNRAQGGLPAPPGLSSAVATTPQLTEIDVVALDQTYLPLPYPTTQVRVTGPWLYDPTTLNVLGDHVTTKGLSYDAQHLLVSPTPAQLQTAGPAPAAIAGAYTRLPTNLPQEVRDTARDVAGTGTAYDKAVRLQEFFRSSGGFLYSTVPSGSSGNDSSTNAIVAFLRDRRGYCVQFASAMAVMARTQGIPARVAVGFLPGKLGADGRTWSITMHQAHAWPELYFDGVGWVRFEPTPAGQAGDVPAWTVPPAASPGTLPSGQSSAAPSQRVQIPRDQAESKSTGTGTSGLSLGRIWAAVPWRLVGAIALVVAVLLLPLLATTARRRRRWRSAASRVSRAEVAWEELRERLDDLKAAWPRSRTPRTVLAKLPGERDLDPADRQALERLVGDLESARYARPDSEGGRPRPAVRADVRAVAAAVAGSLPAAQRRRARWLPKSGLSVIGAVGAKDGSDNLVGSRPGRAPAETDRQGAAATSPAPELVSVGGRDPFPQGPVRATPAARAERRAAHANGVGPLPTDDTGFADDGSRDGNGHSRP